MNATVGSACSPVSDAALIRIAVPSEIAPSVVMRVAQIAGLPERLSCQTPRYWAPENATEPDLLGNPIGLLVMPVSMAISLPTSTVNAATCSLSFTVTLSSEHAARRVDARIGQREDIVSTLRGPSAMLRGFVGRGRVAVGLLDRSPYDTNGHMRNVWLFLLLVVVGCGPSGREVAMAKQARYQGDKLAIFNAAKTATEAKYQIQKSDETQLGLQTIGRWYNPEGQAVAAGMDNPDAVPDQSLNIALVVEVLPEGTSYVVQVRPIIARWTKGIPKPQPVEAKDPSLPGWVNGKADQLAFAIYEALKPYEVKSPGGLAPAPAPAPQGEPPTPDVGSGSATAPAAP